MKSPAKINLIEDWVLGVEPKCLYVKDIPQTEQFGNEQPRDESVKDGNDLGENLGLLTEECEFYEDSDDSVKDPDFIPEICRAKKNGYIFLFICLNQKFSGY